MGEPRRSPASKNRVLAWYNKIQIAVSSTNIQDVTDYGTSASGASQSGNCREGREPVRIYVPVLVLAFAFVCLGRSFSQPVEKEGVAILELGAVADRSFTEGQSNFGPTVA